MKNYLNRVIREYNLWLLLSAVNLLSLASFLFDSRIFIKLTDLLGGLFYVLIFAIYNFVLKCFCRFW